MLIAERLEPRRVLSANQITYDATMMAVVIEGTAVADHAQMWVDTSNMVNVSLTNSLGGAFATFPRSSVAQIRFFGGDGDDRFSNGTDISSFAWGEGGNDELIGGTGSTNNLFGGSGDDQLYGNESQDHLDGQEGNDTIRGRGGNDFIVGGAGNDTLYGDEGNDQIYGQDGSDTLVGGAGNDQLVGGAGDDYLQGGIGNDSIFGGDGDDQLHGEDGNDLMDGGNGNDKLWGNAGNDTLRGGAGHDELRGGDGSDYLYGDAGNDLLDGENGDDQLRGGSGDDYLQGGPTGNDAIWGDDGNDQIYGQDGNDYLDGGAGDDRLWGAAGNDYILGGAGNDQLYGEDGNDILYGQDGGDHLDGGAGDDELFGGEGDDYILASIGNDRVFGEGGNDQLFGQDGDDYIDGGAGDDVIEGAAGNDLIFGGAGNDILSGGVGDDGLLGGAGDDQLTGFDGHDFLVGGVGNDALFGGNGNDVLIGGLGVDALMGQANDDLLIGGWTTLDETPASLKLLVATWSSAVSYASRVQTIESEQFGARLKSELTVFDDTVSDSVFGNAGQDWFFLTGYLAIYRPSDVIADEHTHVPGDHAHEIIVNQLPAVEGFGFVDSLDKLSDRLSSESVHTLVPHIDNPPLQREHLTLYELVRYDQMTNIALKNGVWTDPTTWKNGLVPGDGARVLIPAGVNVRVNGIITSRLASVRVDGKLSFSTTQNTELRVDTIVVTDSGAFEMGTSAQPISSGARARLLITDNGPIDRTRDPYGIGRGLITHGRVSIFGSGVTPFAAMQSAPAGTSVLTLTSAPLFWKVGDTIVVAAADGGAQQNEVRQITAINGNLVTLNSPLVYNHIVPGSNLDLHVAHLTRNVVIESESSVIERRGHVMFMHNRDVHIGFAMFNRLGRTNKLIPINDAVVGSDWKLQPGTGTNVRARYSVHFHRNGLTNDGNPATIAGSVVLDNPGWGFVNHSSYVDMTSNVAFDVRGSAFATEVGDEIGSFEFNLALGTTGSPEGINAREASMDFGFQGDGFWFQGGGVKVVGNISAGNQGHAFVYYTHGIIENGVLKQFLAANLADPSLANGATTVPVGWVPMAQFSGNEGYSSGVGLLVRYHLEKANHEGRSIVSDSKFWNNSLGVELHYAEDVTLRNVTVIHHTGARPLFGIQTNVFEGNITYENLTVGGFINGVMLPRWGNNTVIGGYFYDNVVDILIPTALSSSEERTINLTGELSTAKIAMWTSLLQYSESNVNNFFVNDRVLLNFGSFVNMRLYGDVQKPNAIPFPVPRPDAPSNYIGLTNQQLWNQFGVAIGNAIVPAGAVSVPLITGLIAPNT